MTVAARAGRTQQRATRHPPSEESAWGYGLAAPAAALMVALLFLPIVAVVGIAFTDWQLGAHAIRFVGLRNFANLFADATFRASLANTFIYVAAVVPVTVGLGLGIALLIEAGASGRSFYRAAHFLPVMATMAAMALAWEALLHPTIGLVNQALTAVDLPARNWLRDRHTVLPALAAIGIWQNLGYALVLFLAGLKTIPRDLYDAAEIDGADGALDRLRTVTLPLLGPVMMFVLIVVAMKSFQLFDTVQVLTGGGPENASSVLLHLLYTESFEYMRTGYGAAITVVFLLIVIAITLLQAAFMDRRVHYS
jgi:multiple sugar transport system permease protein